MKIEHVLALAAAMGAGYLIAKRYGGGKLGVTAQAVAQPQVVTRIVEPLVIVDDTPAYYPYPYPAFYGGGWGRGGGRHGGHHHRGGRRGGRR